MIIKFIINNNEIEYEFNIDETLENIKKKIRKDYNIDKHINFIFNGSKPIREFGKYNLIPNDELPSSLDYLKLSNFSNNDREYIFKIIEVENVLPQLNRNKINNIKKFNNNSKEKNDNDHEFVLKELDFPPLVR